MMAHIFLLRWTHGNEARIYKTELKDFGKYGGPQLKMPINSSGVIWLYYTKGHRNRFFPSNRRGGMTLH